MQGNFCADIVWLRPYIRLLVEDSVASEPCWIFARFPSFSIRRPQRRVGVVRVWGSWSNLLCHHVIITCAIHGWLRVVVSFLVHDIPYDPSLAWLPLRRLTVDLPRGE